MANPVYVEPAHRKCACFIASCGEWSEHHEHPDAARNALISWMEENVPGAFGAPSVTGKVEFAGLLVSEFTLHFPPMDALEKATAATRG